MAESIDKRIHNSMPPSKNTGNTIPSSWLAQAQSQAGGSKYAASELSNVYNQNQRKLDLQGKATDAASKLAFVENKIRQDELGMKRLMYETGKKAMDTEVTPSSVVKTVFDTGSMALGFFDTVEKLGGGLTSNYDENKYQTGLDAELALLKEKEQGKISDKAMSATYDRSQGESPPNKRWADDIAKQSTFDYGWGDTTVEEAQSAHEKALEAARPTASGLSVAAGKVSGVLDRVFANHASLKRAQARNVEMRKLVQSKTISAPVAAAIENTTRESVKNMYKYTVANNQKLDNMINTEMVQDHLYGILSSLSSLWKEDDGEDYGQQSMDPILDTIWGKGGK